MPLSSGGKSTAAEGQKLQKEAKNAQIYNFDRWIFKKLLHILNPESWLGNVRKLCQHVLPMTSSKGAKIAFSIELFQKLFNYNKIKDCAKAKNCVNALINMCYVSH